ncbi:MAG: hypothetical protein JSV52_02000 [Candidatus Zixiibacteriota bacterium]|nr:MAG: hypothetical protein JSV52_02000 [candidate division Zixibacteria bacterium]
MKKGILVAMLFVLAIAFAVGATYSPVEAKAENCSFECIDGVWWECCEWTRGGYVVYRCHLVNPVTPC